MYSTHTTDVINILGTSDLHVNWFDECKKLACKIKGLLELLPLKSPYEHKHTERPPSPRSHFIVT